MKALGCVFVFVFIIAGAAWAQAPTNLLDFELPGSQPGDSGNLEHPGKCDNCHGGYDAAVEPAFNWRGSMMAQAARDPFFYACVAIANQDAPDSGDLCIRCHSPSGWLEGRSVPTDGSALNSNDREGVQCDFCHKTVKPTQLGVNPYPGDPDYTSGTYPADQDYLSTLAAIPSTSANGMYVGDDGSAKRGPFVDAAARHQMLYSPYHTDSDICGTCHDVSNPVYWRAEGDIYEFNDWGTPPPSDDPYTMFPIERTFSEWKMSEYATTGVYAPEFAGNKPDGIVSTCQDCHMSDVNGVGCNKKGAPVRPDLPMHDLTGGNTTVPTWVAAHWPNEVDIDALNAGIQRATAMLQKAATMEMTVNETGGGYDVNIRVFNQTGHKLPSGYPEGRRLWLNLKVYDINGALIDERGAYDHATGVLHHDTKIYEIEPGVSSRLSAATGLPIGVSFHFVLNDTVFSDNRIPPRGFTNANFEAIQSAPVAHTYADGQYWDDTQFSVSADAALVTAVLLYQTTSKEYIEFLRDENVTDNWGNVIYDLWNTTGKSAPVAMVSQEYYIQQIVDNEPPTAPANLTAASAGRSQIDLSWGASTDNFAVAGYTIYRDDAQVGTTTATSYADTRLDAATTYTYYVTAHDEAGNVSAASNTASATTDQKKGGGGGKPRGVSSAPQVLDVYAHPSVVSGETNLAFALPTDGDITVEVFNVKGQRVATVYSGFKSAGVHSVPWSAGNLASGVYFARIVLGNEQAIHKITVVR
jgi:chitodextrinase